MMALGAPEYSIGIPFTKLIVNQSSVACEDSYFFVRSFQLVFPDLKSVRFELS